MRTRRFVAWAAAVCLLASGGAEARQAVSIAEAAYRGDAASVERLIGQGADVNAPMVDGSTAIHWAAYRDDPGTVERLLDAGADPSVRTREGVTPLHVAALQGHPGIIAALLEAGADARQRAPNRTTMLMLASRNGNPEAVRLLIDAGAEIDAVESLRGTTALMWAVEQRHPDAVRMLLEAGADPAVRSAPAGLPRIYMARPVNVDAVSEAQALLQAVVDAGLTLEQFRNGEAGPRENLDLDAVAAFLIERARRTGVDAGEALSGVEVELAGFGVDLDALRTILDARAGEAAAPPALPDPEPAANAEDAAVEAGLVGEGGGGLTALVLAAREGDLASARILVDHGADVNQGTYFGWSPVLTATNNRNYRLGTFLIENGADVNAANNGGMTPLYLATDNRNIEGGDYPVPPPDMDHLQYIRILLENGADPDARVRSNTENRTIFTQQWFFEPGATAFVRAAQSGDTALLRLLLDFGADPAIPTDFGDTALAAAAGIGWVDGVTFEWSPEETVEAVELLLELGLDPNSVNGDGRTPLMGAALKGRNEIVQRLVDAGARLETRDLGSRDTDRLGESKLAGHTWQAIDYADGLVRVGVQSAITHPETAAYIRRLMIDRGLAVPPPDRTVESICIVVICQQGPSDPLEER